MDIGRYRYNYEGFCEKFAFLMIMNRGRTHSMHFYAFNSIFFDILRQNLHHYYTCYHVMMKFFHSSYNIVNKLNLHYIAFNFMHYFCLNLFKAKKG